MAPKWLSENGNGKRMSVLKPLSRSRNEVQEIPQPDDTTQPPFLNTDPPVGSRKRFSVFNKNPSSTSSSQHSSPQLESPAEEDSASALPNTQPRKPVTFHRRTSSNVSSANFGRKSRAASKASQLSSGFGDIAEENEVDCTFIASGSVKHISNNSIARKASKKALISAPFDFRHVTHTAHNELPKLDKNDKGLMVEFWASCAQQSPATDLRGIKAEPIGSVASRPFRGPNLEQPKPTETISPVPSSPVPVSPIQDPGSPSPSFTFGHGPLKGARRAPSKTSLVERPVSPTSTIQDNHISTSRPSSATGRRPSQPHHSPSLASLLVEQRNAPTAIHPALRDQATNSPDLGARAFSTPVGTPMLEQGNALGVVTEEHEDASAQLPIKSVREGSMTPPDIAAVEEITSQTNLSDTTEPPPLDSSFGSVASSDSQLPRHNARNHDSGDSWEEDIDYCYYEGIEAQCNYEWDSKTNSMTALGPKDLAFVSPFTGLPVTAEEGARLSPRNSMIRHHRAKSSLTLANLLPVTINGAQSEDIPADLLDAAIVPLPMSPEIPSDFLSATPKRGHVRNKSEAVKRFSPVLETPDKRRWSFVLPSYIPESAKSQMRKISVAGQRPRAQTFTPSPHPPPKMPLPPVPGSKKRNTTASTTSAKSTASDRSSEVPRRPQTPQDRFALHATGKAVQRVRPSTPTSWSQANKTDSVLRDAMGRSKSTPNVSLASLRDAEKSLPGSPELPSLPGAFPAWI